MLVEVGAMQYVYMTTMADRLVPLYIYYMHTPLVYLFMKYHVYYLIVFKVTDPTVWVLHYIKLS